jgi:hypothetical protein
MLSRRPARALPGLVLLAVVPGCSFFHSYRPAPVLVQDAETGRPITAAEVHLRYPLTDPTYAPSAESGTTREDGVAHLRAAPYGKLGIQVSAAASDYLPEAVDFSAEDVAALEPASWFEEVQKRPARFVVALFAAPRPEVELVLPPFYRGVVKADLQVQPGLHAQPGQRSFHYVVPPSGVLQEEVPPLLAHALAPGFTLTYADGVPLTRGAQGSAVGYWWLGTEGNAQCFFVGTAQEFAYRNPDKPSPKDSRPSGRGQGGSGGRGRGRRGGNPQTSDSQ